MSPEGTRAAGRQPSPAATPPAPSGRELWHRLRWTVLRPLAARFGGDERSLFRGPGLELVEVREYQPGDDVRRIDWNVTARADGTYVRETRAERALTVWLIVDVSPSLDWGTAACLKRERGAEFVAVAGQLLGGHGNRVGAITFADRPLAIIPPGTGRAHAIRLLARLGEASTPTGNGPTDLAAALDHAGRVIRGPAVVLVISDFLVPDGWEPALRRLTVRHEVVAVRLSDPREGDLPNVGLLTLEDPETGRQLIVDTADRRLRERFRAAAVAQSERLKAALAGCGVEVLSLGTEADLLPRLAAFLDARRQRRGQRVVSHVRPSMALLGGS
jgi:uncharacterized protein (DUF58 family)